MPLTLKLSIQIMQVTSGIELKFQEESRMAETETAKMQRMEEVMEKMEEYSELMKELAGTCDGCHHRW